MTENKTIWIGGILIALLVLLGLWWISSSVIAPAPGYQTATTTPNTNTTGGTSGGGSSISTVDRSSSSVVAIAENISGASTFGSWLASTGVAAEVSGKGPYTIFVPTDAAIAALPAGTFSNLNAAGKKRFVEYYIVAGRAIDADAQVSGVITALSKDALNFSNVNNIPMVGSAIITTQYKGSNGVVYVINAALIPPKATVIQ